MNERAELALGEKVEVGSHGYVQLVDVMGDDNRVVDAARISYGKHGERDDVKDRGLLRYMMRHRHTTPFEQCEMTFIVKVPMDTWRQWIRHRTANVNEYSTRYTEAIDKMAITPTFAWRLQDQTNRQGSATDMLESDAGARLTREEASLHDHARSVYADRLLSGVAREQARKDLPLSTYTLAYWKIDVHNLMHFLELRLDDHAQLEIREYASALYQFFGMAFPTIAVAFDDYRLGAVALSRMEIEALRGLLKVGRTQDTLNGADLSEHGLVGREAREFLQKLEMIRG
jgi:thymidylate synthase (FAD)